MMRIVAAAYLALAVEAGVAQADTVTDRNQSRNSERLRACTEIISDASYSADHKAVAYRNRRNARADADAGAQALADFNEAIHLRPNEVGGYADRARSGLRRATSAAQLPTTLRLFD